MVRVWMIIVRRDTEDVITNILIILGAVDSLDESTLSEEDSLNPNTPIIANDETNDSDSRSSAKR